MMVRLPETLSRCFVCLLSPRRGARRQNSTQEEAGRARYDTGADADTAALHRQRRTHSAHPTALPLSRPKLAALNPQISGSLSFRPKRTEAT